ncbi:MAG: LysM peptidoglycan-binding domain-containing protein [Verrucomicrobia bacterium]|nr:LysM peptidoglycan-binding domain-containing protein [Verrucomicrobiota bacterium]
MKILKIFGVVVGIHVMALIMIFANPGCSSSTKPAPSPSDTVVASTEPAAPAITVPSQIPPTTEASPLVAAPITGTDYSAPASSSVTFRYTPTRPNTAAAATLEAEPVADVTPATTYTVGNGDNLWTIAKKNHLTVSALAAANNLKPSAIMRPGQKLIIPSKALPKEKAAAATPAKAAPVAAAATAATTDSDSVHHTVKAGETLGAIAHKYGVRVGDIATANNITDPARIRPGTELIIPGWKTPAAKAAKTAAAVTSPAAQQQAPAPIPVIGGSTDLDAGLKSATPNVIQIEDANAPRKN